MEAVMLCLDNSEFSRNGDFGPSRLEAQTDAAGVISSAKTQSHPENVVGVALMSGDRTEIKVHPSQDIGKVLASLASLGVASGSEAVNLVRCIQTCSIALKHRQNKNQKQRLVCFVASPLVGVTEKQLEQLGKVLKKNNVGIDVVSMDGGNDAKLRKLIDAADSAGNPCHLVNAESAKETGRHLSDLIASSPILGGGMGSGAGGDEFGGFDANMDPELAMAIRLSMEEERSRQTAAAGGATAGPMEEVARPSLVAPIAGGEEDDFDAELRAALLASMQDVQPETAAPQVDIDEELKKALAESMGDWSGEEKDAKKAKMVQSQGSEDDPALVAELLASLPGVDVNDPRIREALKHVRKSEGSDQAGKKKE